MVTENSTFSIQNLTAEEKAIREQGIEILFQQISKSRLGYTKDYAEKFYDEMQQAAIEDGDSNWKFYKKN
jgi:hypothetical protein